MSKVYQEGELGGGFSIENTLNKDVNNLPFGLYNPETEGKLTWICNYSQENNIVGVFSMDCKPNEPERELRVYKDLDEAKLIRDSLLDSGWQPIKPPKIAFTVRGSDGEPREMNRKERRQLGKMIGAAAKKGDNE
jgi:hypothetical protein